MNVKNVIIDHGYVQVRFRFGGKMYCKNFGKDSATARELAMIHAAEKRKEILLGKFGIRPTLQRRPFSDVADIYLRLWSAERDENGMPKHTSKSISNVRGFLAYSLLPYFGKRDFQSIRPIDVQGWRDRRLNAVLGTSVNREQAILSSLFSHIETWIKSEQIEAFEIPLENPCTHIKFAKTRKRERVLSTQELSILKASCGDDNDLWEICKMALKSLLRLKDLMRLEVGLNIDMTQAKTGMRIHLPVSVDRPLNYTNFRKRWEAARLRASLVDCQFRDLRKTGANLIKLQGYSQKLISEFLGHTNLRTTDTYMVADNSKLKPLAESLDKIVEAI